MLVRDSHIHISLICWRDDRNARSYRCLSALCNSVVHSSAAESKGVPTLEAIKILAGIPLIMGRGHLEAPPL